MPMNELTRVEKEKLRSAAKKIYTHKRMKAKGFEILAQKTRDERIKQLLLSVSTGEARGAEFWRVRIVELGSERERAAKSLLRDLKVGFMMRILGTKGFFEWVVVGEEEGIRELAYQAEKLRDAEMSAAWSRAAADEGLHLEKMKAEVLGMEAWEVRGSRGVRDMIFGANDGMVSTLAFIAGVAGAITDPHIVLLSAIAELFAGTISMAAGSYQSAKSEVEVFERESQRKNLKRRGPAGDEREELVRFYEAEGFRKGEAKAIVDRIITERERPIQTSTLKELGLKPEELGNPVKAGILCGGMFGLAALVPILPFVFPMSSSEALLASIVATIVALFGVGAMKTIFSRKGWVRSGLEMMLIGAAAAAITYTIGKLFSSVV
jgi:VIT1/CCC1 family predicted Fe2+/Mn2+ transporter